MSVVSRNVVGRIPWLRWSYPAPASVVSREHLPSRRFNVGRIPRFRPFPVSVVSRICELLREV